MRNQGALSAQSLPSCGRRGRPGSVVAAAQRLQAAGHTAECAQLGVRVQQASHVLLKCHDFPSTSKAPAGGSLRHSYMLRAPRLHCPGAEVVAPGAWLGPKVDKKEDRKRRRGRGRAEEPCTLGRGLSKKALTPAARIRLFHSTGSGSSGFESQVYILR